MKNFKLLSTLAIGLTCLSLTSCGGETQEEKYAKIEAAITDKDGPFSYVSAIHWKHYLMAETDDGKNEFYYTKQFLYTDDDTRVNYSSYYSKYAVDNKEVVRIWRDYNGVIWYT